MGLVKLYRVTGEERYLQLAKFLLDVRGPDGREGSGKEYNQSHLPVVEQREAVGHAVRATYMYAGMADVAAITRDQSYVTAIDAIWENVVSAKLYVTGGIGSTSHGEAFGGNFQLPNMTAYNETCAAIGNVYWNHRLFLLHGHGRYIDVLERTLYNGLISGVSLDGRGFFYPNPLESKGQHARSPWFGCACCPSNISRFMASLPGYVYAQRGREVFVNLFVSGTATMHLDAGEPLEIRQETNYPWNGSVRVVVQSRDPAEFTLSLRIPGWAREQPVPSDLYRFVDAAPAPATLKINGELIALEVDQGFARLRRRWTDGDVVELELPMPVRRIVADERVEADRGRVAFQRGPIVYCFEWPDNPQARVRNLLVADDAPLSIEARDDLLGGVVVVRTNGRAFVREDADRIGAADVELVAIPYYAWAHRGRGEMAVWVARQTSAVRPARPATPTASAALTITPAGHNPGSIRDGVTSLLHGEEQGEPFFWWPRPDAGHAALEYTFAGPERVSESSVYWFDDTGTGGCRVPAAWRLLYKDGSPGAVDAWCPVTLRTGSAYTVEKDCFNRVEYEPITATALRLEVELREKWSGGVCEWGVK
jgi:DUF1680 family protein